MSNIIIADITTLKWRGFVSALLGAPFLVNGFIGSNISSAVIQHAGWRWGCTWICFNRVPTEMTHQSSVFKDGMFAILIFASLSPLVITLLWVEKKTKRLEIIEAEKWRDDGVTLAVGKSSSLQRGLKLLEDFNLVGLILLGAAIALILVPLTISSTVRNQWRNGLSSASSSDPP